MGRKKKNKEEVQDTDKQSALSRALGDIEKQFGKGSIMKLDDENYKMDIDSISTGSVSLDCALGIGGVPRGRVVEIYGPESSGKTTLALTIIKELQKQGGTAAFIDAEHAFDYNYAKVIGVNLKDLFISQPSTGEEGLEIAERLTRSKAVDLIIIDSVAALTPRAEIEGEMGDSHMGLQARLMSQALRKLTGILSKTNTCIIFINQIRHKIGVMFGSPETTTGGRALKFYASVRIDLRRIESLKKGEDFIGNKIRATIKKNKVAPPFKKAEFDIFFDEGISKTMDILGLAIKHGIVKKSGPWLSYDEMSIGQGVENTRKALKDNPKLFAQIEEQVYNILGIKK